jgi:hypothetical protein
VSPAGAPPRLDERDQHRRLKAAKRPHGREELLGRLDVAVAGRREGSIGRERAEHAAAPQLHAGAEGLIAREPRWNDDARRRAARLRHRRRRRRDEGEHDE